MLVVEPVLAIEALDHVALNQLCRVRLLAHAVDIEKRLVVPIQFVLVGLSFESSSFLLRAVDLT